MVNYYTLEDTPLRTIHDTFVRAFADYEVDMRLPLGRFSAMLHRRGYAPALSIGAIERDELVGFLLNAVRDWQGVPTAYNTGTGVVPEFRRRGVTKRMFREARVPLGDEGVRRYLMEVINENMPAKRLYRQLGFERVRGLTCYTAEGRRLRPGPGCDVELKEVPVRGLDWGLVRTFWDFYPSWQNSTDSVMAASAGMRCVAALVGEGEEREMVGYGVIEPVTGDLPQLAVRWDYRDQGVGRAILDRLVALCEARRVAVVNVEEGAEGPRGFLEHLGFAVFTEQSELLLGLA